MSTTINEPVTAAIDAIRNQFVDLPVEVEPDGAGGARLIVENVPLGGPYVQSVTWIGAHVPAQTPYSDIYPIFVRGDLSRQDEAAIVAPITHGHKFMERNAVQVSRRTNAAFLSQQDAAMKFQKVLSFLLDRHP